MFRRRFIVVFVVALFVSPGLRAQFVLGNGEERTSRKWNYIETQTYKVIYPRGLDSLARVYARELELGVEPVSFSSGNKINSSYKKKWPVVLHAYNSVSNGFVAYPPHRSELYTTPDPYAPVATPWERHLTLHESRHIAQMQFATVKPFRWTKVLAGGLSEALWPFLYGGATLHEGDAVYAETALTAGGRGRSADFLEYMRVAFGSQIRYSFFEWQYGMLNHYAPDYYRVSYLYYAGLRSYYNGGEFNSMLYNELKKYKGIDFTFKNDLSKKITGKKFKDSFAEISDTIAKEWAEDERSRAPFMPITNFSVTKGRFTEFNKLISDGNNLYAVRSGIARPYELVKFNQDGSQTVISSFSSYASQLRFSPINGLIYWSEYAPNLRWGEESNSDIFYLSTGGVHRRLTKGHRYYNPAPSSVEPVLAVVSYPIEGGSSVEVLSLEDGVVLRSFVAPSGFQAVEPVWLGKELYVSGLTSDGFGIYKVADSKFIAVLAPVHTQIKQVFSHENKIMFTSDRSGVNELYSLNPFSGEVLQLSSTPYGAADFCYNYAGDTLYYTSLEVEGRHIASTDVSSLMPKKVEFQSVAQYPIAKDLDSFEPLRYNEDAYVQISEPQKYKKFCNMFRVHSWLPVYFDKDNISSISFSDITSTVCLGATIFSQNHLNTLSGSLAYKIDPTSKWRSSFMLNLTYSGLYPVFEAKVKINEANNIEYYYNSKNKIVGREYNIPSLTGYIRTYIPFNFSSGGLQKGLIPSISFNYTIDRFEACNMSRLTAGLRGYIMESIPSSRKYPRFGIGAEVGYSSRPFLGDYFNPAVYFYGYGYLPGFTEIQGLKYSVLYQHQFKKVLFSDQLATIVPRGYDSIVNSQLSDYNNAIKLSMDYVIPFLQINYCLLGLVYFRNLEFEPHIDFSYFSDHYTRTNLLSAGADFSVRIETPSSPVRIGFSFNYLGGQLYSRLFDAGLVNKHFSIGLATAMNF